MLTYSAIIILCLGGINGQVLVSGGCPDLPTQSNFNLHEFLGVWYERYTYSDGPGGDRCNLDTYTLDGKNTFNLVMSDASDYVISGFSSDSFDGAKFLIVFALGEYSELPFWILETDYDSYAVVWTCMDIPYSSLRYAWLLTRNRTSSEQIDKALSVFNKLSIDPTYLREVDQLNCFNEG